MDVYDNLEKVDSAIMQASQIWAGCMDAAAKAQGLRRLAHGALISFKADSSSDRERGETPIEMLWDQYLAAACSSCHEIRGRAGPVPHFAQPSAFTVFAHLVMHGLATCNKPSSGERRAGLAQALQKVKDMAKSRDPIQFPPFPLFAVAPLEYQRDLSDALSQLGEAAPAAARISMTARWIASRLFIGAYNRTSPYSIALIETVVASHIDHSIAARKYVDEAFERLEPKQKAQEEEDQEWYSRPKNSWNPLLWM